MLNRKAAGATWQSTIKLAALTTVFDDIVASYERLLDARDALRPKCVVVAHSYCYFQPTGRKATGPFGLGKAGPGCARDRARGTIPTPRARPRAVPGRERMRGLALASIRTVPGGTCARASGDDPWAASSPAVGLPQAREFLAVRSQGAFPGGV